MSVSQKSLPKWILVVSAIFALLEIAVSVSMLLYPEATIENVDLTAKGVDYLIQMWAVRQLALGAIFALATIKRSAAMLTIAYVFLIVMFIGDLVIGIAQQNSALIISAVVMCVIATALIYAINRKKQLTL